MNITFNKIASALAFLIGVMAIFAGGQVLLGKDPGYHVINWLVLYNYTIGILTVFTTAARLASTPWSCSSSRPPTAALSRQIACGP